MKTFFTIVPFALLGVCLFIAWLAWPVKPRKVDTQKRDKEIDDLLDLDEHEIKSYHPPPPQVTLPKPETKVC